MFLSHIKTRHGYDVLLYCPHEYFMSFLMILRSVVKVNSEPENIIKIKKTTE